MNRKWLCVPALVLALLSAFACSKKEDSAELEKAREWEIENFTAGKTPPPTPAPLPKDLKVEVPASVRAKHKSVVMGIGNRKTLKVVKFTVKLGSTANVPGTDYTIKVWDYLPAWSFKGNTVTTNGEDPIDPAVRAIVYQKGKAVFDGFIFQKHKTPSFATNEYAIGLLGTR